MLDSFSEICSCLDYNVSHLWITRLPTTSAATSTTTLVASCPGCGLMSMNITVLYPNFIF